MSKPDSDGSSENEWDDRGELAWNEVDWENYLRTQEGLVAKYLKFYEKSASKQDRIDVVAQQMGWDQDSWSSDEDDEAPSENDTSAEGEDMDDSEPYTVQKNPIYIATKAIYLSLKRVWEKHAADPAKIRQPLALAFLASLHRGEEQSTLAIHALDFGDYAMAISLFKRALREINKTFSLVIDPRFDGNRTLVALREEIYPKLFDLREIWFRVISECREELDRPSDDDDESDE